MEELIWFSIPGAILAAAIIAVWPSSATSDNSFIWIALVPLLGFTVHQTWRLIFERTGGFARKTRTVLQYIANVLAQRENKSALNIEKAFLVWETVFYSGSFPAPFRDHDRGAWHYIHSFWGISLSATVSFVLCLIGRLFVSSDNTIWWVAIGEAVVFLVFWQKGKSTYESLVKQEVAIAHIYEEIFLATLRKLEDYDSKQEK